MSRKAAKSSSEIFECLKDLTILNDKSRPLNLTHSVWEEACIKLDNVMSKKYMYLYVSQNRYNLLNKLLDHGITTRDISSSYNSSQSNWSILK